MSEVNGQEERHRAPWRHRLALAVTVLLILSVLVLLPVAIRSMWAFTTGRAKGPVYDFLTGDPVPALSGAGAPGEVAQGEATYINIDVVEIDETGPLATLGVSGNRICQDPCAPMTVTLFSLDDDAPARRGLPPSAAVTVPAQSQPFTASVQLPVGGRPQRYPFDSYRLWLGLVVAVTQPDGTTQILGADDLRSRAISVTFQDEATRLTMRPPVPIEPSRVRAEADPYGFVAVQGLDFERPAHLQVLTVLLVLLISASGFFALFMRALSDLILGIGGLILGIWGVRSVVVQTALPDVTFVDIALGAVILMLLLGLAVRAAVYFHHKSELAWPLRRRSRRPSEPAARPDPARPDPRPS